MQRGWGKGSSRWWHGEFRGCGYRMTIPREVILQVLDESSEHLSAEDIYMNVHHIYPAIGLTTVYRTLELLVNMGFVAKYEFGDKRARFELIRGTKKLPHHHHLICTNCGKVINYTDHTDEEITFFKRIEKMLSEKYNFEIKNHTVQYYGICNECSAKK